MGRSEEVADFLQFVDRGDLVLGGGDPVDQMRSPVGIHGSPARVHGRRPTKLWKTRAIGFEYRRPVDRIYEEREDGSSDARFSFHAIRNSWRRQPRVGHALPAFETNF